MSIFRNVVFLAVAAGLAAGLVMTVMQTFYTVPLILQAETFENAGQAHDHTAAPAVSDEASTDAAVVHEHEHEGWAPADGTERTAYTALANIVTGIGLGLLLVVASEVAGGIQGWRRGLFWGFAGFAAFTLAPGLGLPPELPGMPAADLLARQVWWIATVAATAAGLWFIAFGGSSVIAIAGAALLIAPHVVGAPQPVSHETLVPVDLHHQFIVAVTLTNLVFWMLLGVTVAYLRPRLATGLGAPQGGIV